MQHGAIPEEHRHYFLDPEYNIERHPLNYRFTDDFYQLARDCPRGEGEARWVETR